MIRFKFSKYEIATFIALLFHVCGFIGMFTSKQEWFISNTPLNLLLMFGLILWTHSEKNLAFFLFTAVAFAVGMLTEIVGVNTALLFGEYQYGKVLGAGIYNVPLLIGINWITVIYCCGVTVTHIQDWFFSRSPGAEQLMLPQLKFFSFVSDAALLATVFDFILEPVAVKLGYWKWLGSGEIPFSNFVCWFVISALLLTVFKLLSFPKRNQFAVHLLIIEMLFFTALRTFL